MDKILKIQSEIGVLVKTETNGLLEQLLPLLEKYELTVIQPLSNIDGKPALKTVIFDGNIENNLVEKKDGNRFGKIVFEDSVPLPELQDPQKMGSAITYYRRYSLQSLFLLRAEDDDANVASSNKSKKITETEDLPF